MKSTLVIALLLLTSLAFAQSEAKPAAPSEADKSFDTMKSLAGKWLGRGNGRSTAARNGKRKYGGFITSNLAGKRAGA